MNSPLVYIVIVNWNKPDDTCDCLESVFNLSYQHYEVIVIDNNSTDGSVDVISRKYPNIIILKNVENIGYTGGNNLGIDLALDNNADYVWLLNNDTLVQKDSLTNLVCKLEENDKIGLASPLIYYNKENTIQFCGSYLDKRNKSIIKIDNVNKYKALENEHTIILWGTALLIKKSVINDIGKLDDKYFAYHEDCDYCIRAAKSGFRSIVEPTAIIYHTDSLSTGGKKSPIQAYLRSRNLYFLWANMTEKKEIISFARGYVSFIVSQAAQLYNQSESEAACSCINGAWNGYKNNGGHWKKALPTPKIIYIAFIFIMKNHPFFWAKLIRGNYKEIYFELYNRITTTSKK